MKPDAGEQGRSEADGLPSLRGEIVNQQPPIADEGDVDGWHGKEDSICDAVVGIHTTRLRPLAKPRETEFDRSRPSCDAVDADGV